VQSITGDAQEPSSKSDVLFIIGLCDHTASCSSLACWAPRYRPWTASTFTAHLPAFWCTCIWLAAANFPFLTNLITGSSGLCSFLAQPLAGCTVA
jgi:hypothetical protein